VIEHMDVNGLRRLIYDMFPTEGFSNEQIEEGFTLIDLKGTGKIIFSDFCEVHLLFSSSACSLYLVMQLCACVSSALSDIPMECSGGLE
jgi:hypothetical protein